MRNFHSASMRTNLIMHFHCAECGSVLQVLYENEQKAKNKPYQSGDWLPLGHDPEPTGAACRYVDPIQVVPCATCIEKYVGPARKLTEAIAAMSAPRSPSPNDDGNSD